MNTDKSKPIELSIDLLYRINDALSAILYEAGATIPDEDLDALTHTVADAIRNGSRANA